MCGPVSWLRARCDVGRPGLGAAMGRGVLGGSGQGEEGVSASAACVGVPGKSGGGRPVV